MSIETIRDDVRHTVAKAGFLSADEVTDAVFDLIRAELTGDEVVEAVARAIHDEMCEDGGSDRDGARAALAAVATALGGDRG